MDKHWMRELLYRNPNTLFHLRYYYRNELYSVIVYFVFHQRCTKYELYFWSVYLISVIGLDSQQTKLTDMVLSNNESLARCKKMK